MPKTIGIVAVADLAWALGRGQSGPATKNGIENFTAMQIARDLINERGGINGRKVELLLADIPTPTAAVSETERLITKEGVKITLGSGVSQLAIPVSQTAPPGAGLFFFVRPLGALPGGPSAYLKRHPHRRHPKLSVAAARKVARGYAGKVAGGGNPAADLQAERARRVDADYAGVAAAARPVLEPEGFAAGGQDAHKATLRVLLAEGGPYECELARRRVVNIKPALSSLRRGLARLMSAEVTRLTRRDLSAAIDAVELDRGPGSADDLRKFTRVFLEWCIRNGLLAFNPLAGLRRPMHTRAERLKAAANGGRALADDEIRSVWQAAGGLGSFGGLVRLALLTGLRRGELAQLERARDLLADRIVIVPEHAKTGAQHEVPLTPLMREVIAGAPVTTSKLLFPSLRTGRRMSGWTMWVAKLQRASGVDFHLHDLRRTCRTLMSRLGVGEDIAELAIGHVRADLVARYNKDQAWDGRCDAFAKVSDHIAALIGARAGAAVIPLRG